MKRSLPLLLAVYLFWGCAANTTLATSTRGPIYSAAEKSKMTTCFGMSDTAMYIADQKLRGVPIDKVKQFYASRDHARLTVPLVEKVYGDPFTSAWDYTVAFFRECAHNMASVPRDRVGMASYCLQNGMIAGIAQTYRASGAPKANAYAYFAKFESETPRAIVDRVYAGSKGRAETKLDEWNSCMSLISAH